MWSFVGDVLVLLAAALVLGAVFERLRQSAILGYLLAGTLLAPLIKSEQQVTQMAELGVALLLFAIGLEFSVRRLVRLGPIGLVGGTLQIVFTGLVAFILSWTFGVDQRAAIALGAMAALSSTACVLRMLTERAEIDSVAGRNALGILLLQDVAVVPLVVLVTGLSGEGSAVDVLIGLGWAVILIAALTGGFWLISNYAMVRLFRASALMRNHELLILLAMVVALGSTWAAHALGLSPALGAFVAGIMLAESPFAMRIRADVSALRTLFVTLFFASIGMLGDLRWIAENVLSVVGVVAMLLIGKTLIVAAIVKALRYPLRHALATGLMLAQVGEFSFVIAAEARGTIIDDDLFRLFVSATLVTLFITPFLVTIAPKVGQWCEARLGLMTNAAATAEADDVEAHPGRDLRQHVIIVGFGPAGQRVCDVLTRTGVTVLVVDLHPRNTEAAKQRGLLTQLGDATSAELWHHVNLQEAAAVAIVVPDHRGAVQIAHQVKAMAPHVPIVSRSRYHAFVDDIQAQGVHAVVDEERLVGWHLGREVARWAKQSVAPGAMFDSAGETSPPLPPPASSADSAEPPKA